MKTAVSFTPGGRFQFRPLLPVIEESGLRGWTCQNISKWIDNSQQRTDRFGQTKCTIEEKKHKHTALKRLDGGPRTDKEMREGGAGREINPREKEYYAVVCADKTTLEKVVRVGKGRPAQQRD